MKKGENMKSIIKKLFQLILLFVLSFSFFTVPNIKANEVSFSHESKEVIKKYPGLKEQLLKNTNGKLVGSVNQYFKVRYHNVKDQNSINKSAFKRSNLKRSNLQDVKVEMIPVTKEEYDAVRDDYNITNNKMRNLKKSKPFSDTVIQNRDSWISLNLQVYETKKKNVFQAYNFWEWKKEPLFRFTDGALLFGDSPMVAMAGTGMSVYYYHWGSPTLGSLPKDERTTTYIKSNTAEQVVVLDGAKLRPKGYVTANFEFGRKQKGEEGNIYAQYIHKESALGGISLGADGGISISSGTKVDKSNTARIHVKAR